VQDDGDCGLKAETFSDSFSGCEQKIKRVDPKPLVCSSAPIPSSVTPSRKAYSEPPATSVAQEILRHSHLSTTADLYLRVDQHAMATALAAAKCS